MPGRIYTSSDQDYKFGFNGEYKNDDVEGGGVQYDYGFRIYDARIAKFLSVDPLTKSYPELTPYQFASNTPIQAIDLEGLGSYFVLRGTGQVIGTANDGKRNTITIIDDNQAGYFALKQLGLAARVLNPMNLP